MMPAPLRVFSCVLLAALPVAAQKIGVEFDEAAGNARHPALNNELVRKKIENEIRKRLTEKGLTQVAGRADLNVRHSLGSQVKRETDLYPAGWRGRGTRRVTTRSTEGTLIIDLRDTSKKELVWRAIAVENKNDPAKIDDRLDEMVKKSFDKFPPGKK
ncbi:MAG: DUF4136 domain-containing protein [Bryobacteraceae bacterium]